MQRRIISLGISALTVTEMILGIAIYDGTTRKRQSDIAKVATNVILAQKRADEIKKVDPKYPGQYYRAMSQHERFMLVFGALTGLQSAASMLMDLPYALPKDSEQLTNAIRQRNAMMAYLLAHPQEDRKSPAVNDVVKRVDEFYRDLNNNDKPLGTAMESVWVEFIKERPQQDLAQ